MILALLAATWVWTQVALACPDPLSLIANSTDRTKPSTTLHRRWFSLNGIHRPPAPYQNYQWWGGPWPWRADCKKYRVTCCFEDQQTHDEMWEVFMTAVGRWSAAMLGKFRSPGDLRSGLH